jgi:protein-S-isoprenylcysteine O-methyltransferase Ste14
MKRAFWIGFGLFAQVLFAATVCRLFPFLQGSNPGLLAAHGNLLPAPYAVNAVLAVQFAILHSWLLLPTTRRRLEGYILGPLYGCFFCFATCISLLLTIELWQPTEPVLWHLHGIAAMMVRTAFLITWLVLLYSLSLTGLGYQTGWTPYWAWLRGRKLPPRRFEPRGAYRLLRHPIYLSFLGLVWLTPAMTLDRAVLTGIWTAYIFVGSWLKDRRLIYYVGDSYREYQSRIPGYPFFLYGPLARVPLAPKPSVNDNRVAA